MRKLLPIIAALLLSAPAFSADNAVIVTPGLGITMKSKDVGAGVQSMQPSLIDQAGAEILGQVTASPAANTLGARLVTINTSLGTINTTLGTPLQAGGNLGTVTALTGITNALPTGSNIIGRVGIDQTTPGTTNLVSLTAETTKVIGTVRMASGGVASGSFASGALASGSVASGAMVDLGAQADSVCGTAAGTCSLIALTKYLNNAVNSSIPAGTNIIGNVGGVLNTTSGWTTRLLNGLTNTAVAIKASGGQLSKIYCYNPNSSVAYIQIYNVAAGSVTVGTTSPAQSYGIPPTNSSGYTLSVVGDQYGTAISAAATTTVAGATGPSTALDCNASYN